MINKLTLLEAMANNTVISSEPSDPSVGYFSTYHRIESFDAEQTLRDFLKADPEFGWYDLMDLIGNNVATVSLLFIEGEALEMRERLEKFFLDAIKHQHKRFETEVIQLVLANQRCAA